MNASWGQPTAQVPATNTPVVRRGEPITLNFTNADIEAVARTMATLTGRNVVVDPRVKGTITLTTGNPHASAAQLRAWVTSHGGRVDSWSENGTDTPSASVTRPMPTPPA